MTTLFAKGWRYNAVPFRAVIAAIFMAELERNVLPMLSSYMTIWKVYMDDTIAYVKIDVFGHVISILNSFQVKISFTYEQEIN